VLGNMQTNPKWTSSNGVYEFEFMKLMYGLKGFIDTHDMSMTLLSYHRHWKN
jgi:hypothetical protein